MALGTSTVSVAQDDALEEIIVTGSHVRRTGFEGRAPIQIVDAEAIALTGALQPVEVLKALTSNSGSQFYNETNNRAGVSMFNIRNLGLGSTLTLINGRRAGIAPVADDTGTDFFDINQLPIAMISRIDVLTDGASATYGSQAVAGVANIITRKGFEGFELSGGYSTSETDTYVLNLAAGSQFDKGGFNVYATYYTQNNQDRSDFDWMLDRLIGQGNPKRSRFLSSTGSPGSFTRATIGVDGEATSVDDANFFPDATCEAAGGVLLDKDDTGESGANPDDRCRYHFVDQVSVISAEERIQTFAEFDWQFNDTVKYYTEASFSNNLIERSSGGSTLNTGTANGGGFTIPAEHPFNFWMADPGNTTGLVYVDPSMWNPATMTASDLRAVARPLGAEVNHNELTQKINRQINYVRFMQGLEFNLPRDWFGDVSYGYAKSTVTTDSPHNYRSREFQDLVKAGEWNPFGTRLSDPGLVSPKDPTKTAGTDPLVLARFDERSASTSRATENVVDAVATGDIFDTGMGTWGAAVGAQYRKTEIETIDDSLSAAGEANEQGLSGSVKGVQDVVALFGEVIVPFNDWGELQVAARYEDYGGAIGSTTDPKLSFEVRPTDWLGFRGSFGTSFQAPTIRQTASASSSAFIDDPASPTGPGGSLVCVNANLNNNITVSVEGADDLVPQTSDNFNLGVIFQTERFRASIDYWNFDYTDLIAQSEGAQAIVDNDCLDDGLPNDPRVIRDAGGQLREVKTQFVNIGSVQTDGIDIHADYNIDVGDGSMVFDFTATYVNKFDVDSDGDGSLDFDGAGSRNFRNNFSTMPQLRANLGGTWLTGNHSVNLTARYIDSYKNDQSNNGPVDSWTTFDALFSIVLPELIGSGDTTLTLGVNNIANEEPPALRRNNSDGTLGERFRADGTYNRGWVDRPGYDDKAGHDIRGRIVYFRFVQGF